MTPYSLMKSANGNRGTVVAAHHFVTIEEFPHSTDGLAAFVTLDRAPAPLAEVVNCPAMAVVDLFAILLEPTLYKAWYSPLLGARSCVFGHHDGSAFHPLAKVVRKRPFGFPRPLDD